MKLERERRLSFVCLCNSYFDPDRGWIALFTEVGKWISKLTTKELQALLKRIPKEIDRRKQQEKSKLMEDIAQLASKHGYSLRNLIGKAPRSAKRKKARKRKPVAVRYRHPEQVKLTLTGRGRKPLWVTKWLGAGKTMDALAV